MSRCIFAHTSFQSKNNEKWHINMNIISYICTIYCMDLICTYIFHIYIYWSNIHIDTTLTFFWIEKMCIQIYFYWIWLILHFFSLISILFCQGRILVHNFHKNQYFQNPISLSIYIFQGGSFEVSNIKIYFFHIFFHQRVPPLIFQNFKTKCSQIGEVYRNKENCSEFSIE